MKNICVFCSSSDVIDSIYQNNALELAKLIVENNFQLVNGGSKVGFLYYSMQVLYRKLVVE